jgi:hypothetical protein
MKRNPGYLLLSALLLLSILGPAACKKKKDKGGGPVTSGGDTIAPSVSNTTPGCGQSVQGTVALSADARDNIGVTKVEFLAGSRIVATDTEAPYEVSWDTSGFGGQVTLTVRAFDAAGNMNSSTCQVTLPGEGTDVGRKRLFISSDHFPGSIGGIAGADNHCAALAAARGHTGGVWRAWLSDSSTNAIDRIEDVGPWYFMDQQTMVFANKAAILNGPQVAIQVDETGNTLGPEHFDAAWTGTLSNGTVSNSTSTCSNWTDGTSSASGTRGLFRSADPDDWTAGVINTGCQNNGHIYCFEQ